MLNKRIIPVLLLRDKDLVHITKFSMKNEIYIGDPINVINIFNEYHVDEMIILDIGKSSDNSKIDFEFLSIIAGEAFFPICYGGGITSAEDSEKIIEAGFEKIIINNQNLISLELSKKCINRIGSQSVIASIDIIEFNDEYFVYDYRKKSPTQINPKIFIQSLIEIGVGEICITSTNLDGTMTGCNFKLIESLDKFFKVPIIYKGGGGNYSDIKKVLNTKVSAFASSTIFVMKKPNSGIVLNYPSEKEKEILYD
jgi:cyclase